MGLQSVTRKASVLNQYMGTLGDPLAYRTELEKVFAVTPEDVTRVARQYLGREPDRARRRPGRAGLATARGGRRPRAAGARWPSPAVAEVKDTFDRSVMPTLGPTPHYAPPPLRAAHALERPRSS